MKVEALLANGTKVSALSDEIDVKAHDRSGFAFSNDSYFKTGSGAYNDDGTLKAGAKVLYLYSGTAPTVKLDVVKDDKGRVETGTGIAAILKLKEKGYDKTPLAIRIIGKVTDMDMSGQINGDGYLEVKAGSNYSEMNITIEGIGDDAYVYGWGILLKRVGNVEIRNLGFALFPDDGISADTGNCNIWIHHNDFFYGKAGSDSDQAKGDGSTDIKKASTYMTVSYNHYWDSGKVSLCGLDETEEFFITYHHNWFDHSDSRHPRIRTGSIHIYNNYYDGISKYGVGVTMGGNAFVEKNHFRKAKYPLLISKQGTDALAGGHFSGENGGMIKAYRNIIEGANRLVYANSDSGTVSQNPIDFDAYLANSRDEQVPSTYKARYGGTSYNNFDGTLDLGVSESAIDFPEDVARIVKEKAGRLNGGDFAWNFTDSDDTSYDINQALMNKIKTYTSGIVAIGGSSVYPEEPEEPVDPEDPNDPEPFDPSQPWILYRDDFAGATADNLFLSSYKSIPNEEAKPMYIQKGGKFRIENGNLILDGGRFTVGALSSENTTSTFTPGGIFDLTKPYQIIVKLVSASGTSGKKFQVYVDNNTTSQGNSIHGNSSKVYESKWEALTPGEIIIQSDIGTASSFIQIRAESGVVIEIEEILIEYLDHTFPEEPNEPVSPENPEDPNNPEELNKPEEPEPNEPVSPEDPEEPNNPEGPGKPDSKKENSLKLIIYLTSAVAFGVGALVFLAIKLKLFHK